MSAEKQGAQPQRENPGEEPAEQAAPEKLGKQGWMGCIILIILFFVLPTGCAMWSEGAFDPDLSDDVTAVALSPADTARLVERLQEASQRQRVCYGWEVDADTGAPVEIGSNLGVGVDARQDPVRCPRWVVLEARFTYQSKEWTGVSYSIEDSFPRKDFRITDLYAHDVVEPTDLGDRVTAELADGIGSLPLLAAQEDLRPVPVQERTPDPTASDNDELESLRGAGWWVLIGFAGLLVALGLLLIVLNAVKEWRKTS
ncbi:hypothetical protein [Actinocorallia populi]|uniref:hypothetical protein n=1 Tax=Actinocorallia populi TaxID=2079200 RepID=UPI000D08EFE5|nr:hypothetical protein [Actinocorallia populi]